jgi:hypothetical protein
MKINVSNRSQMISAISLPVVWLLTFGLCLLLPSTPRFVASADGEWKDRAFWDNVTGLWITAVTSTVKKQLTCTVTWNGISVGKVNNGQTVHGTFTLVIPAWPGYGAAMEGRSGIKDVSGFHEQTVCG